MGGPAALGRQAEPFGRELGQAEVGDLATAEIHEGREPGEPRRFRVGVQLVGASIRLIEDYLGHRDPRHTIHYTRIVGSRFEGIWS
jgi:hypothetical protein